MPKELNPKQQKFIDFYVRDKNATKAAIAAGYSEKTAYSHGQRMLKHVEIKNEIDRRLKISSTQLENATQVSKELLIQNLLPIILGDIGDVANWDADELRLIAKDNIEPSIRKAIQAITASKTPGQFGTTKRVSIKMHDKLRAIEVVGKLMGYIVQKNEHTGANGEPLVPLDESKVEDILIRLIQSGGQKFE